MHVHETKIHIKLDCVHVRVNTVEFSMPSGHIRLATTIEPSNGETASTSNGRTTHLNTELRPLDSRCSSSNECASGHHDTTEDRMLSGIRSVLLQRITVVMTLFIRVTRQSRHVNGTPQFLDRQSGARDQKSLNRSTSNLIGVTTSGPHQTRKHWYFYP